jgi:toxin YoeB
LKKYDLDGVYARKISEKHHLVYSTNDEIITGDVVSAKRHYDDE